MNFAILIFLEIYKRPVFSCFIQLIRTWFINGYFLSKTIVLIYYFITSENSVHNVEFDIMFLNISSFSQKIYNYSSLYSFWIRGPVNRLGSDANMNLEISTNISSLD